MKRRDFMKYACVSGLLATSPLQAARIPTHSHDPAAPKPVGTPLRVLHLTDIHIRPEENAPERCRKILKDIRRQAGKIDFVLNTGDSVYNADAKDITRDRMQAQWTLWDEVVVKGLEGLAIHSCLGNHDMWWAGSPDEPMRGKAYACKRLGMPKPYYAIDKGNWKIIVLDGNNPGMLDDAQFQWLGTQIEGLDGNQPVLLMSHQPIVHYEALFKGMGDRKQQIIKPLHNISRRVHFISGHTHEVDVLRFHNLSFHSNGALSGHWWEAGAEKDGAHRGTPMGYAVLELYPDGRLVCNYYDIGDRTTTE